MKFSPIIYLDTSFVVDAYEMIKNKPAPVKVTKSEDINAGLSAGFISAGASVKETKEFPISSHRMYDQIEEKLTELPSIDWETTNNDLPEYFWIEGVFGATSSQITRNSEVLHHESFFRLYSNLEENRASYILVTNDVYLSTGYDQIQKHLTVSCQGFGVEIKGLFRLLSTDIHDSPICAPLIMYKKQKAEQ